MSPPADRRRQREDSMYRPTSRSLLLLAACLLLAAGSHSQAQSQGARATGTTVYEGARLITGDGSPAIENSAFVVENDRFTRIGPRGEVQVPAGATRVDLTGKTVM